MTSELLNEELSDNDMTMDKLSSRIGMLESSVKTIKDFDQNLDGRIATCLDTYFGQRQRGGTSPSLGESQSHHCSNTPDSLDGEGAGR